jgi:predicted TIM-barrel fold metal-dependent hydrolase
MNAKFKKRRLDASEMDLRMIVDCHTHINCPSSEIDAAEHREATRKVDTCIVLAVGRDNGLEASRELSEHTAKHPKLVGFATLNPLRDRVDLNSVKAATRDLGLKGLVVYCSGGKFHPAHSKAMKLYEAAAELRLPVFFHNSSSYNSDSILQFAQPYLLDEVARQFPNLKIVIGGMGLPFLAQTICMLGKHETVFADLSVSPHKRWELYNTVISVFEAGVMDKLLFGSGYPICRPDNCIEALLGFNMLMGDTNLPSVPREEIRNVVERDTLAVLGVD